MTSAYPPSITALLPKARRLVDSLGEIPSRNMTMRELRIGRDKATALLELLGNERRDNATDETNAPADNPPTAAPAAEATDPAPEAAPNPPRPLRLVTDTDTANLTPTDNGETPDVLSGDLIPEHLAAPSTSAPEIPFGGLVGWVRRMRTAASNPAPTTTAQPGRAVRRWPLLLLAAPAFVAIWSGWVGLGVLTGFGPVHPLPGIADHFSINTAITLPIGVETYAAYALRVWLGATGSSRARWFAKWSALGSLALGVAGQIAYHLMTAWHVTVAPWPITAAVACLPVIVLGFGAALSHLQHTADASASTAPPGPADRTRG